MTNNSSTTTNKTGKVPNEQAGGGAGGGAGGRAGGNNGNRKKRRNRGKKGKFTDGTRILAIVMDKSSLKEANLSQTVDKHFNSDPLKTKIDKVLKEVRYLPTVGETVDGVSDITVSVLPKNVVGEVNLPASAIMKLNCINKLPEKRNRRGRKMRMEHWEADKSKIKDKNNEKEKKKEQEKST